MPKYKKSFNSTYLLRKLYVKNSLKSQNRTEIHKNVQRVVCMSRHRGLKLDGTIGQGAMGNSLKRERVSKSFLAHIGKNKIKF